MVLIAPFLIYQEVKLLNKFKAVAKSDRNSNFYYLVCQVVNF